MKVYTKVGLTHNKYLTTTGSWKRIITDNITEDPQSKISH